MNSYIAVFLGALVLALALTPGVRRLALAWGAVDLPGERKVHAQPVPRLGGVAVLIAVVLAVAGGLWLNPALHPAIAGTLGMARWGLLAAAVLLVVVVGGVDDFAGLRARTKFLIEIAAAAAVVFVAGAPLAIDFSPFASPVPLGILEPILGILWIVTITNAVNMFDGMDGAASGLGAIAAAALGLISLTLGNTIAATVLLALAGGLVGFLPHNFRSAKTFLGDTGSLGVGFILGSASLVGLEGNGTWLAVPAFLALALFLAECSVTVLRRTLQSMKVVRVDLPKERYTLDLGRPGLFVPDRRHIHHRLLDLGLPQDKALGLLYAVGGMLAVLGVAAVRWPELGPFAGLVLVAASIYFVPRWLYEELRLLERGALLPLFDSRLIHSRAFHGLYDAAAVAISYLIAEVLVNGLAALTSDHLLWARVATVSVAALIGFRLAGLYRLAYRHAGMSEVLQASRAVVLGVVLGGGSVILAFGHDLQLAIWLLLLFFLLSLVVVGRLSFRILDHVHQRSRNGGRRVLIFGAGRAGGLALRGMLEDPSLKLAPVAFADDDPSKWGRRFQGFRIHPGDGLEPLLRSLKVDDLVVSTSKLGEARRGILADACLNTGVRLLHFGLHWEETNGDGLKVERPDFEFLKSGRKDSLTRIPTSRMIRIVHIAGARPNFIKIAPVMAAFSSYPEIEQYLVHTGQHYDAAMSEAFFDCLDMPRPDVNLEVGSGSHAAQTALIMTRFEPVCEELRPDLVLGVGDVNSTLACALVAAKLGVKVGHVEAGLRSFDWTMPEEINRVMTDHLSDLAFTTEPSANENLRREGVQEDRIHFVGNVMIDTLLAHHERARALHILDRFELAPKRYALVTLHRPSNVDAPSSLGAVVQALATISEEMPVVFPAHPRTVKNLKSFGMLAELGTTTKLVEPLGYLEFLGLMSEAAVVLTDSGGIQEETTVLGVPCLTLRPNTERPVTIEKGTNRLVKLEADAIVEAVLQAVNGKRAVRVIPDLWDGRAAERIADVVVERFATHAELEAATPETPLELNLLGVSLLECLFDSERDQACEA